MCRSQSLTVPVQGAHDGLREAPGKQSVKTMVDPQQHDQNKALHPQARLRSNTHEPEEIADTSVRSHLLPPGVQVLKGAELLILHVERSQLRRSNI